MTQAEACGYKGWMGLVQGLKVEADGEVDLAVAEGAAVVGPGVFEADGVAEKDGAKAEAGTEKRHACRRGVLESNLQP